jgi:hypothetical protein
MLAGQLIEKHNDPLGRCPQVQSLYPAPRIAESEAKHLEHVVESLSAVTKNNEEILIKS